MMERQEFPVQRTRTLVGSLSIFDEDVCWPFLQLAPVPLFKRTE